MNTILYVVVGCSILMYLIEQNDFCSFCCCWLLSDIINYTINRSTIIQNVMYT